MPISIEDLHVDVSNVSHHPLLERVVDYINIKTQNHDKEFFRVMVAYYFSKLAGSMWANIITKDRGIIPVNGYAIALANSGYSKGHSIALIENLIEGFRSVFSEETMPLLADVTLRKLASQRAGQKGTEEQAELELVTKEYESGGEVPFTFDSATVPAIKQLRSRILMTGAGALNLQIDELSLNLLGSTEPLTAYLELYDVGKVNTKLTKNTAESKRVRDMHGRTPSNLLLFGTPLKVFDGSITETQFNDMLEMGYARRCLFAFALTKPKKLDKTPEQVFIELTSPSSQSSENSLKSHFLALADIKFHNWNITLPDNSAILLIRYKMYCEQLAGQMPEHRGIEAAEVSHRYFKALKLAGALAFVNLDSEITEITLKQAIKLVEESGKAFEAIRTREKNYVRLAKFIASNGHEVTQADLVEQLPYFKGTTAVRGEMMQLATAWGFNNHIIITKRNVGGIELFSGEKLKETDPDKLIISYSNDLAYDYEAAKCKVDQLPILAATPDIHWCNHAFKENHRLEANAIPEFNLVVIDVDGGFKAQTAHELLRDYVHMIYTTKRSTDSDNRFRIVMPISHILKLNADDYRQLMDNLLKWLPFNADTATNQRSRKWLSNPSGSVLLNTTGALLDVLPFIPRISQDTLSFKVNDSNRLEGWFLASVEKLGRNNAMLRYGFTLVDTGHALIDVNKAILELNAKLPDPLKQTEIESTIFKTIAQRYI